MVLGWLLLLVTALPPGTTAAKDCLFCELTDSKHCPGSHMHCGDDENCFTGHGVSPGAGTVINKGCVHATSCGREEPVSYKGVTYSLITTCCFGHMCNDAPSPTGAWVLAATSSLVLGLLVPWHLL